MRTIHAMIVISLLTLTFLSYSYPDDYTGWELPEGAELRLGKGQMRDLGGSNRFQFSPDSKQFFVYTLIGIWVYDTKTGDEIRFITGTMDCRPENLVISPDNQIIASQTDSWDISGIQLLDFNTGKLQNTLKGHIKRITSIDFSPDGQLLVSGDFNDKMIIWDFKSGQHRKINTPHNVVNRVQFSPNGQTIMSSHRGKFLIWDVKTGKLKFELKDTDRIRKIVYSPDGKLLVGTNDWWIIIWDAETGMAKMTFKVQTPRWRQLIAISPDGKTLANVSENKDKIHLWDLQTQEKKTLNGKPEHTKTVYKDEDGWFLSLSSKHVHSMVFSPDGRTLALSTQNEIQLWDTVTGKYKLKFRSKGYFYRLIFSPDGRTLVAIGNRWNNETGICLFNIDTNDFQNSSLRYFLTEHRPEVSSVAFSPDGRTLASGYAEDYIRLWDVSTGKLKQVLGGNPHPLWIQSVTFSPNGNTLACLNTSTQSSGGIGEVLLWNVNTGEYQTTLKGHGRNIGEGIAYHPSSIAFSPDGKVIVSGSLDGTVRLWNNKNRATNSTKDKIQGVFSGSRRGTLKGHTDQVISVAISPDGHTIASGSLDKTVRLWDLPTNEFITSLDKHPSGVKCVAFSPDGKTLASSDEKGTVYLWDYITADRKAVLIGEQDSNSPVLSLEFSPDGETLAGGGSDIFLWDMNTQQLKTIMTGHRGYVNSVKFSPDGRSLASGSNDGTVLLWKIE